MSVLILVPGLVSFFLVQRGRIETAFLSVYLPCLLLLPDGYSLRIPHLPPLSAAQFALIPLGVVAFSRFDPQRFLRLNGYTRRSFSGVVRPQRDPSRAGHQRRNLRRLWCFCFHVFGICGRKTVDRTDLRFATLRRFVILVLLDEPPGLYEWKMGSSLYGMFVVRNSWASRISGRACSSEAGMEDWAERCSADSEGAGIAFGMTFCLNAWLVYLRRVKAPVDLGKTLTKLEKYHVPGLLLLLCVWLTQSREPQLALGGRVFHPSDSAI